MAAFKNKDNGTWYVQFRYTDWKGERQQKLKRGFATKREALEWEREFLMEKQADVNMTFESFVALYEKDIKPKLKLNTWLTKESIIKKKILPYFANRKLSEITAKDIIRWQNEIRELRDCHGKPLSKTYLKTVHNQLSAIFNHAARFYGLNINPARQAGNMGAEERKEMLFWTREEYTRFSEAMMDKPLSFYAFEVLYWCGVREGELLALTPADFDFEKRTVTINKSYQRLNKQDVITTPTEQKGVKKMPAYKNKDNGSWYVVTQYTDWTGERKPKCKRGFATRREALEWEQKFQQQSAGDLDMSFEAFVEIYTTDLKARLKESTWQTKEHIIQTKILPYFGKRKINEITTKDVIAWQNELLAYRDEKHKPYSQSYLKTLHNQLSAIFNHAVRFYDLRSNPAAKAGNMGSEERKEMLFWTKEEYQKFAEEMMDKPISYYAFQMLYWTGIREGELLALTPADFDFERGTVKISKTYQRLKGKDVITSPKTKKSNRTIQMPDFLCEEMQEFFKMQYGLKKKDRIFTINKSYLHREMDRGAEAAGVKRIRIHDLRHSHISLLIDMGFSAVQYLFPNML